jgi:macrolide transport system ATP-binding/permease protein
MAEARRTTRFRFWLWSIRLFGILVPRRLRADWRQEWEAELQYRETLLAEWDKLNWRTKLDLLWRSSSAFWDALMLQPKRWEDDMLQDLRFGLRMLCKNPGFSAVVLLTLAFGIGVNTALFTVFNAFVLKPLPIKDADSFVVVQGVAPQPGQRARNFSFPDYQDYAARNQSFSGLTLMSEVGATLGIEHKQSSQGARDGQAQREEFGVVNCQLVAANYFSVLGAEMVLGRGFLPEEERTPNTHPVVVLSYYFWERSLNRDPQVIGRTIRLAGQPFTIVGVTNQEFIGTEFIRPVCWVPLMMLEALRPERGAHWVTDRTLSSFYMYGRLKPGVTVAQAQAELSHLTAELAQAHPAKRTDTPRNTAVRLTPAPTFTTNDSEDDTGELMLVLPLSVALVLLIACANVANLMLARAANRQKEIATRLALGATRWRIVRQLLTESVLIALAGGVLGLLLAWWALSVLYPLLLAQVPIPVTFRVSLALNLAPDYRVFGFALLMALLAGVTAGLAPAWQASRPDLTSAIKGEGSVFGEHLSQSRLRNALIVTQLAFSLVLLVSAGLLVRNLQKLQTVDTGYETARLFTIEADFGLTRPELLGQTEALRQQLEQRLRALPDVQAVSRTSHAPLEGGAQRAFVTLPGHGDAQNMPRARFARVSSTHLATLGVPLLHGRNFTEQEAASGARVAVISAATVRQYWPQFNDLSQAIGQHLSVQTEFDEAPNPAAFPVYQVIGVTRDLLTGVIFSPDGPFIHLPFQPGKSGDEYLLVRTRSDASRVMATIYAETAALNPNATVALRATAENVDMQNMPFRVAAKLALVLGLIALALAAIGLYGVMSFVVAQRTREIGVRVALGAQPRSILTLFIKQGMRLIAVSIVLGLLGGAGIARLLALILVDLSPFDPLTFGGVSLCLTLVALLATYLPARRATRVDPMIALRHD